MNAKELLFEYRMMQAGWYRREVGDSIHWRHTGTGKVLDEANPKDAELLRKHREAGTTPPPF